MGLEPLYHTTTPNYYNTYWPAGTDLQSHGDDHIRLVKATLRQLHRLPEYADDAAAKVGGLVPGDLYRTSAGTIHVVLL